MLSTNVTRVSVDDKVGYTSRLVEALSSTAIPVRVLLRLILTQNIFIFNLITKLHERVFYAHCTYIYRELVHLTANLIETLKLAHPRQSLNLEVLFATFSEHLLLLLTFDR